ncbi:tape measure protein [Yersinia enterocolitica]|nr:tape measure protein [Yersinia enterocolitica]ELW8178824.1 tape measure protein [Yersinia enterocolitica]
MSNEKDMGGIVFEVDMEMGKLLSSQQKVNSQLDQMGGKFDSTTKSVDRAEKSMFSLSHVATSLATALSVQQVAEYGNAWVTVSNKLVNAIRANEDLLTVTNRVFDISQDTRAGLEATATLYGRLERATRSAGTSTADLAKLTTTINKGLVVSGATAEEASSTMIQLSQALASGVLRGEEFNSISENGSRLAVALADSLGVTVGQLRAMAAEGKLTTDVVVNGLLKQSDAIAKEFGNTVLTMGQAFTVATNNITKFIGESSSVNTALNIFNQGVITLSENLGTIANVIGVVSTIIGGRYVSALVLASAAKVKGALDAQALAKAELQTAQAAQFAANAAVRKALADKEAAISALNLAQAEYNVAKGSAAEALALDNLSAKKSIAIAVSADLVVAENSLATASNRTSAAARAASVAWTSAKGALALVGGPTGVAFLAGAALFYFYQRSEEAKKSALDLANAVNSLIGKMKEMSSIQLASEIGKLRSAIPDLNKVVNDAQHAFDLASREVRTAQALLNAYGNDAEKAKKYTAELTSAQDKQNIALDNLTNAHNALGQATNGAEVLQSQLNGTRKEGIELLKRDNQEVGVATGLMKQLGAAINFANRAKGNFNSSTLSVERSADADKILDDLKQENALLAIKDDRQRAITKARLDGVSKGAAPGSNQLRQIEEEAARRFDLQQVKKEDAAATKSLAKEESAAASEAKNRTKQLSDLSNAIQVTTLEMQGQSRAAAQLASVQKLGVNATPKEIALAKEQAGAIYDLTVQIENMHKAKQGQQFAQQEITSALSPTAQIDVEEQAKLAKLAEYQALDTQNTQIYEDAKTAIQLQASQKRQDILDRESVAQIQAINSILGAASQGFDGISGIIEASGGKASGAFKAMFALSKGFAVAQAALNLQMAISQVMADPTALTPAQKFANYAAIASAGGAVLSSIGSISYGGGRKNGGGVNADSMYQVGEGGEPELLKASNGKQYMIPGDNGKVISNKDMQGGSGGAGTVVQQEVHFNIQTTNGIDDATMQKMAAMMKTVSLNTIKDQQRPNGLLRK